MFIFYERDGLELQLQLIYYIIVNDYQKGEIIVFVRY